MAAAARKPADWVWVSWTAATAAPVVGDEVPLAAVAEAPVEVVRALPWVAVDRVEELDGALEVVEAWLELAVREPHWAFSLHFFWPSRLLGLFWMHWS